MRLTIRGWAVVAIVAASIAMSWQYGPRALNAIVVPLVVVLLAGFVVTLRIDRPEVRRLPVEEGFIGETREVEFVVETDSDVAATVRDAVGTGLSATGGRDATDRSDREPAAEFGPALETILDGERHFTHDVRLEERGERTVGPLTIAVSDILGLTRRRFEFEETATVVVYPRVHELRGEAAHALQELATATAQRNREEFDHLREYRRGDSLRDVHWKAAAKQPDDNLVVTEYAVDEGVGSVTVAAECTAGREDELATAVASIAVTLLETNVRVGLVGGDVRLQPNEGRSHYYDLLGVLAGLEPGAGTAALEERERADAEILVTAETDGTTVDVDGRENEIPFTSLRGDTGRTSRGSRRDDQAEHDDRGSGGGPGSGVVA